ncbi:MAG TPA: phenylacetic acid degradation protein PaaN [Actinopolymorphaceae bacterium]
MDRDMRVLLDEALAAIRSRQHYSAFPESPSPRVYGAEAASAGQAAFEAWKGRTFPLSTPGASGTVASENSPYGIPMDIAYPRVTEDGLDELFAAAAAGRRRWRGAGADGRLDVCLEILRRLHGRAFELANAVMATTGQGFVMAFQAGVAHALDRALEALALAYAEMGRWPTRAVWEKPTKGEPLRMEKTYTIVPVGTALVIGCTTFPTWNSCPGLFASLVTGNSVVVKPHPGAVLPLAITVQVCQEVLRESGFDPHLVTLAAERPGDEIAQLLVTRPEVRLIDYTGGSLFGRWIEEHAHGAAVFAEKSGVNPVVVDSTDSFRGLCANLAFTLSLYSGQMCTTTQSIYVPADGIETDEGHKSFADVGNGIASAIDKLLSDDARAVELLGAVVNESVQRRIDQAPNFGEVVLESRRLTHPTYPEATVRTPALVAVGADDGAYGRECFGPVTFLVRTSGTAQSLELVRRVTASVGAMTFGVYSTSESVLEDARETALDAGIPLSENLTDGVYVNQSAAFSDFHGTGVNPAANAALVDSAFVAPRFRVVQIRRHA